MVYLQNLHVHQIKVMSMAVCSLTDTAVFINSALHSSKLEKQAGDKAEALP